MSKCFSLCDSYTIIERVNRIIACSVCFLVALNYWLYQDPLSALLFVAFGFMTSLGLGAKVVKQIRGVWRRAAIRPNCKCLLTIIKPCCDYEASIFKNASVHIDEGESHIFLRDENNTHLANVHLSKCHITPLGCWLYLYDFAPELQSSQGHVFCPNRIFVCKSTLYESTYRTLCRVVIWQHDESVL